MKKVFLTNFPTNDGSLYGVELQKELKERGVNAELIDVVDFALDLGNGVDCKANIVTREGCGISFSKSIVFMKKRNLSYHHITTRYSSLFLLLADHLGAECLNRDFFQHHKTTAKPAQYLKLISHGFRIPRTILVHGSRVNDFKAYIESVFSYPFVLKADGSGGKAVWKISKFDEIASHLNSITDEQRKETIIIQEFVQSSNEEFRALVFLGEIVTVIKHSSESFYNKHDHDSTATSCVLTDEEVAEVKKVATISRLDYLGVDFMKDEKGTLLYMELQTGPSITTSKMANPLIVQDIGKLLAERAEMEN